MNRPLPGVLAISAAAVISVSVLAQQQPPDTKPQPPAKPGQMMSMDGMMKGCREHCQATTKSLDQAIATINDAKGSNDPAKMRVALDQAAKPLADMKEHMGMCMNMMKMMGDMHGKEGMKPPEDNR